MRIIMLAPHVFYKPRGTPLSVYYRAKALAELGHTVDVVAYSMGEPIDCPGVRLLRAPPVPFTGGFDAGPSISKIFLDAALFLRALWQVSIKRYDVIYTNEESSLFGAFMNMVGMPHIYGMHSSMPMQLKDWNFSTSKMLLKIFETLERFIIRHSDVFVAISGNVGDIVKKIDPNAKVITIEDTAVVSDEKIASTKAVTALRKSLGLQRKKCVVYTGTFFVLQNLELLINSVPSVVKVMPDVMFVLVGGEPAEIARLQKQVDALGVTKNVLLLEKRPITDMPAFLGMADVLVSPRSVGINGTLKLYSYLNAGKAVLATDCPIHNQLVQEPAVVLAAPEPKAWGYALKRLLADASFRKRTGTLGKKFLKEHYSYDRFKARLDQAVKTAVSTK